MSNVTFGTSESDAESGNTITVCYDHGTLVDKSTGVEYLGGEFTQALTLKFTPNRGYEFMSWEVSGSAEYSTDSDEIKITSVQGEVNISVVVRNYSTSQELINIVDVDDLPDSDDELVLAWSFKSSLLNRTGGMWKGMPCTPLIVGNVAYIRAAHLLYAVDMDTGTILNQVTSTGYTTDYYHYISYGNGIIFDTTGYKAYDLDLNYLYDIPSNLRFVSYHDGYFYGCLSAGNDYYTMYKTSADRDSDLVNNVKQNLFSTTERYNVFAQYGQFSNVLFVGDWFFFLQADMKTGSSGYRAITAFNIKTEESVTCRLTGFEGMPWDDGWLTYYDGYFYLTAYTAGLFGGVIKGLEDKRSSLMWVKFDFEKGTFEEPSYKNIQDPEGHEFKGIASGLVIYNGRGYLNVRALETDTLGGSDDTGSKMIVYEIGANGEPFPKQATDSAMTHGGIVVNTAHADEGKVLIYMIPYNVAGQALYVFTDELIDGEWTIQPRSELEMARTDWCSQAIRAGPNGEMLFYVDSGYIDCYISADKYWVNIVTLDGTYAKSEVGYGKNVQEILKKIYPTIEINGSEATIGSKQYQIYGLNEVTDNWVLVTNTASATYSGTYKYGVTESAFRQIVLLEQSSSMALSEEGEKGWYYFDGEYKKTSFNDKTLLKASMGCSMFYLESKPSDGATLLETDRQVNRDSTITITLPSELSSTYTVSDDSVISVLRDGNSLTVKGLTENVATVTITIEGKEYVISVNVLPKVTVVDGKTLTESVKDTVSSEGNKVHTESKSEESADRIDKTLVETTCDSSGKVISKKTVTEAQYKSLTMENYLANYVQKTEQVEKDGTLTVNTEYNSETFSINVGLGAVKVVLTEITEDKIAGTSIRSQTVRSEYTSYDISVIVEEHYVAGSMGPVSSVTKTTYASKQAGFDITRENDTLIIDLDEDGTVDVSNLIQGASDDSSVKYITINAKDLVNADSISSAAGANATLVMNSGISTITLNGEILNVLATVGGNVSFKSESDVLLNPSQQSAAGDAKVFSISLLCGDSEQHEFGEFTLSITCDIQLQEGKELKVWRIDDSGNKTYASNVSYNNGKVSFDANHLSIYAIGYESESADIGENNNNTMLIVLAVIVVVVLLGGAFALKRRT